jgi:hypothetical protein
VIEKISKILSRRNVATVDRRRKKEKMKTRGLNYETFYSRNLRIFVIS